MEGGKEIRLFTILYMLHNLYYGKAYSIRSCKVGA